MIKRLFLTLACILAATSVAAAPQPLTFDKFNAIFTEGSPAVINVVRTGAADTSITTTYHLAAGLTEQIGTLNFAPGELSKPITIPIVNDNVYSFYYNDYGMPGFISLIDSNMSYAITNFQVVEDEPVPVLTAPPAVSVAEGNSGTKQVTLHFTLSAPFGHITPYYFTFSGPADSGDYTISGGTDSTPGLTSIDLTFNVKGDINPEPDETVVVTMHLGNTQNAFVPDIGRASVAVTILNDEYSASATSHRIERDTTAVLQLTTSVPAEATEHFTIATSDPSVASVPASIDVPAGGGTTVAIPIKGVTPGFAAITVTLPPSRGGGKFTDEVTVFEPTTVSFDNKDVAMVLGTQTTVTLHVTPPPRKPLTIGLLNSKPSVAEVPALVAIDTDSGTGTIAVRAIGVGATLVNVTLPPEYGAATYFIRVDVALPSGLYVNSLSSKSGPATGDQLVTLFGNSMKGRCTVTFGGTSGLNTSAAAADGSVTTYTPPHTAGVVDVAIRCGTEQYTFPNAYTYTAAAPRITRIAPALGSVDGGTIVTVNGENMPRGRCGLWFDNAPAMTLTNLQTTEMSAIAPPHAAGAIAVTLRCGADSSKLNEAFVYTGDEPLAEIAVVNPSSAAPGERVLIGGSRFRLGDAVAFGGVPALDMTTAPNEHFVTVPEMAAGAVNITMRDASGRTVSGPTFVVRPPAAPQITSAPAKVTAGSELLVNGSGFRPSFSFALGGATLRSVNVASTFAVLRVPSTLQPQTTTLVMTDTTGAPLASRAMEVVSTGVAVESVSPQCVSTEGGALVTIHGNGFEPGAVVTFGIADATDVVVRDAHIITARAPASSGVNDATITVTNPSLEKGQLTGGFVYRWPDSACGPSRHRPAHH